MAREYREIRKRLGEEPGRTAPYISYARKLLGQLKADMAYNDLKVGVLRKTFVTHRKASNGEEIFAGYVHIEVRSMFGQDIVDIKVPEFIQDIGKMAEEIKTIRQGAVFAIGDNGIVKFDLIYADVLQGSILTDYSEMTWPDMLAYDFERQRLCAFSSYAYVADYPWNINLKGSVTCTFINPDNGLIENTRTANFDPLDDPYGNSLIMHAVAAGGGYGFALNQCRPTKDATLCVIHPDPAKCKYIDLTLVFGYFASSRRITMDWDAASGALIFTGVEDGNYPGTIRSFQFDPVSETVVGLEAIALSEGGLFDTDVHTYDRVSRSAWGGVWVDVEDGGMKIRKITLPGLINEWVSSWMDTGDGYAYTYYEPTTQTLCMFRYDGGVDLRLGMSGAISLPVLADTSRYKQNLVFSDERGTLFTGSTDVFTWYRLKDGRRGVFDPAIYPTSSWAFGYLWAAVYGAYDITVTKNKG